MDEIGVRGRTLIGAGLIVLGVVLLLNQVLEINLFRLAWPFFVLIPGLIVLAGSLLLTGDAAKGANALGSMVTAVGALLFVQNATGYFESWAYAWALVAPTSVGVGLVLYGLVKGAKDELREGLRVTGVGLGMFIIAFIFFEGIIGIGGRRLPLLADWWPVLLILLGLFELGRRFLAQR